MDETPRYVVEHGGWAGAFWDEDDPTPEEARKALRTLGTTVSYADAIGSLRESAEAGLAAVRKAGAGTGIADA